MRAAFFKEKHKIEVWETGVPEIGPDDILVRVMAAGICGTDMHIYDGEEGAAAVTPPVILGHECAGVVEKTGSNVTELKAGDRVALDPNEMCGECIPCKTGAGHYCQAMTGYGTTANGGFAEFLRIPAKQAYLLADSVSFDEGCFGEPVSCCLHGIDLCGVRTGDTVLVIGGGAIGQIMLQLARLAGAAVTVLSEPVEEKRERALALGATYAFDPRETDLKAVLASRNLDPDVVIECVGRAETMADAVRMAKYKATVMWFGLTAPDAVVPVKPFEIFKKELTIRASYINPYTMERSVKLINSGRLRLKEIISKTITLEELDATLSDRRSFAAGKVIVHPQREKC